MSIRAKDEDILKGWQLQFDLDDPDSGAVKNVDIVQIPLRQR